MNKLNKEVTVVTQAQDSDGFLAPFRHYTLVESLAAIWQKLAKLPMVFVGTHRVLWLINGLYCMFNWKVCFRHQFIRHS